MKKEKNPILVIFCIFLLSLFIVLPPLFRMTIPKQEKETNPITNNVNTKKLTIVNCNRIYENEMYQVNAKTKYVNNDIESNIIKYQKLQQLPENYNKPTIDDPTTVEAQLNLYKTIPEININITEELTTVELNSSLSDKDELTNYLRTDPNNQKKYYESIGYTCNIMEG